MKRYVIATACAVLGAIASATAQTIPTTAPAAVRFQAVPFDLQNVRLLDGPFKRAMETDKAYLLSLDPGRLLHVFRVNAGLPSSAQPLGGWEGPKVELRGHFAGHYLSACALMYRATGDERFKQRADTMVAELRKCQEALGDGYLSAFPASFFDRVEAGKPVWAPYYTIHKIMAGLLDVNQLCDNAEALKIVDGMAAYFKRRCDKLSDEQMAVVMRAEFGGMNEVFANLYGVTHNPDHLAMAERFDDHKVFDPLAKREDRLAGLHANTQIPKITGAARLYELTGDDRMHTIADYFWTEVTTRRSFAFGGNSFDEHFRPLGVEAGELTANTAETCNTYNMLKLTRHLFQWQPQATYADYYERALFNHILGSIEPGGGMLYFLSLKPGHFKVYNTPTDSFWCCTGTGVENHAKYGDSIYFHDDKALWVNQFIASEVTWPETNVTVRQETGFPTEQGTTLTVKTARPHRFALNIRVPYWATKGVAVKVNGQAQSAAAEPASYVTLDRQWADGDKVEVGLPMGLHLHRASDKPQSVVAMYGPIVLAGELGRENYPSTDLLRNQTDLSPYPAPRVPVLVTSADDNPDAWIKPVAGKPLTFTTSGVSRPNDVTLVPLYAIQHERYNVYWQTMTPVEWTERAQRWQAEDDAKRAEEARVVDSVRLGEPQPETDHAFAGQNTRTGRHVDRPYREAAAAGGWFSVDLKTLPDTPNVLRVTYWGGDNGPRFDVVLDGKPLLTQTLTRDRRTQNAFITVDYPIPAEQTAGKTKLTVRFQPESGSFVGRVFDCRILRAESQ